MGFLKRVAGFLGLAKEESHEAKDVDDEDDGVVDEDHHHPHHPNRASTEETTRHLPRKGFSVPVKVPVDRPQVGPVLIPCSHGDGGVQGLKWYAKRLRIDEDGDVADEFLDEIKLETSLSMEDHHRPQPRFEVKYNARLAKVRKQVMSLNGQIQQCVEYQGRLHWV